MGTPVLKPSLYGRDYYTCPFSLNDLLDHAFLPGDEG